MSEWPQLFDIDERTHARRDDPATSKAAAARLSNKTTMMRRLLWQFASAPATAEEASLAAGYDLASGAWKRVSDLAARGLIIETGHTRPGRSGREQRVMQITDAGRRAL